MSKPKTHELPPKSKTLSDFRNQISSAKIHEKTVAEISMRDFLDFLKISYQVNEAIENPSLDVTEKGSVNWKKLTSDALISRLKEREALLNKQKNEIVNSESQENFDNIEKTNQNGIANDTLTKTLEQKQSAEKITESTSNESFSSFERKLEKISLCRRKAHSIKKDSSNESEPSFDSNDERIPARKLKKKLNEVLQEGILDSVLPYLLPKPSMQENAPIPARKLIAYDDKKTGSFNLEKNEKITKISNSKEKVDLRRKLPSHNDSLEKDIEVIIHVCDEIKNLKKDFRCSQKLLLSQMGYFAEVTAGQKLEDMDISVHCDITIFDWLMQWIQKDALSPEHWPILDPTIAVPVLMSSAFLQMGALHEHCLKYCKNYISDIIRESPNLNCINDNVLTRLANLFSNSEVELIMDKKDRIQSKLFCKLIVSLTEPEIQPSRGHYSSLATIYRCSKCLKLILKNKSNLVLCVANNMKMDRFGTIHSTHVYDPSWNLSDYIRDLKITLKSWRRVYWRLWADCHILYCQACEEYFSLCQMSWCRYHVESVQYFPLENKRSVFHSVGRYPCCGERVYRFEVVKKNSGCQYRDHIVNSKSKNENDILRIWNCHRDAIKYDPPPLNEAEKIKFLKTITEDGTAKKSPVGDGFWWEGLEIVPSKQPNGFLNKVWEAVIKKDDSKYAPSSSESKNQKSPVKQSSVQDTSSFSDSSDESPCSSNEGNSEESFHVSKVPAKCKSSTGANSGIALLRWSYVKKEKKRRKRKKKRVTLKNDGNRFWLSKLSTRSNQDNQREFEERALKQMESVVAKKLSGESFRTSGRSSYPVVSSGGIYVRIEQEWRENHCFSHGCPGSSIKARGSASHLNLNNSTFSVHRRSKSRGHR